MIERSDPEPFYCEDCRAEIPESDLPPIADRMLCWECGLPGPALPPIDLEKEFA